MLQLWNQIYGTASEDEVKALHEIMRKVEGEPYADVLSMMLLRSMQQLATQSITMATYGLAASIIPTSPIRRYPDLMVHRMVLEIWKISEVARSLEQVLPDVPANPLVLRLLMRSAVEAMKKAEYLGRLC